MTNKEIAKTFQLLAKVMELHGENIFKIRSYTNAYRTLRKLQEPLSTMSEEEIGQIQGVGQAISAKIGELLETGEMQTLNKYLEKTPPGVVEMLHIPGFGPKKVYTVWQDLGVENIGELLYAVNENRLIELKGFGKKTQKDLRQKLEYYQRSRNQFHFATVEEEAEQVLAYLRKTLPDVPVELTGEVRRQCNTVTAIDVLVGTDDLPEAVFGDSLNPQGAEEGYFRAESKNGLPIHLHTCAAAAFGTHQFLLSGAEEFLEAFSAAFPNWDKEQKSEESAVFTKVGLPVIDPVLRESAWALDLARRQALPELLQETDIKGVVHCHSTYSDGINSLREMAEYSRDEGYEYLVMTDHSKSAFYANGLQPERVLQQMEEIDALNKELAPFRIFKGIESDILSDGSLDYEENLLKQFEVVIASVHSNLRMDEQKATERLLKAIENPYITILGHPTGRLLLSREGYPVDHRAVIDACAGHNVSIELNANPYRLDLDWSWIPYALEKGVLISINPDAHSTVGIHDIHYGVCSAGKGGLTAGNCLNAKGVEAFSAWLTSR